MRIDSPLERSAEARTAEPLPALPAGVEHAPSVGELLGRPIDAPYDGLPTDGLDRGETPRPLWRRTLAVGQFGMLVMLAYVLLFNFSVVRGSSMAPTIYDGDRILIDHVSYMFEDVQRGDIVVLKYPFDPSIDYIKRVIGLPGDEILIENGAVYVNGELIWEPYVSECDQDDRLSEHVRPAHFFVLGDNRPRSSDSREFGQVPQDYVRGRVDLRVWPPARIGRLD